MTDSVLREGESLNWDLATLVVAFKDGGPPLFPVHWRRTTYYFVLSEVDSDSWISFKVTFPLPLPSRNIILSFVAVILSFVADTPWGKETYLRSILPAHIISHF